MSLKVVVYTPNGTPLVYKDAEIESNLIPDLSFIGINPEGKKVHVSTSLGYLIEKEL